MCDLPDTLLPDMRHSGQFVQSLPRLQSQVTGVDVYVVDRFGGWHAKVLAALAVMFDEATNTFPADAMQQVGWPSFCPARFSLLKVVYSKEPHRLILNQQHIATLHALPIAGVEHPEQRPRACLDEPEGAQTNRQAGLPAAVRWVPLEQLWLSVRRLSRHPHAATCRMLFAVMPFAKFRIDIAVKGGAAVSQLLMFSVIPTF